MKTNRILIGLLMSLLLSACSKDYRNVVPSSSIAVLAIEPTRLDIPDTMGIGAMGLDLQQTIYGFELPDGTFGVVAQVADEKLAAAWMQQHTGTAPKEKNGYKFAADGEGFVFGLSSSAMLVMGPVVPAAQAATRRRMEKLLDNNEPPSSPLFDKLATLDAPIALVARSTTLPQKYVAPLLVGAPKGVQGDQVLLAAKAVLTGSRLDVEGELFSPKESVDKSLREAVSCLRPIQGNLVGELPDSAVFGLYVNVEGEKFLQLLRTDKDLRMMLAGLDTETIRAIDGDAAFVLGADKQLHISSNDARGEDGNRRMFAVVNLHQTGLDFVGRWLQGVRQVTYTMK